MIVAGCGGSSGTPAALVVGPSAAAGGAAPWSSAARCDAPAPPDRVEVSVQPAGVSVRWAPVGEATDYIVAVGLQPGGSQTLLRNTVRTTYEWVAAPAGTHYARVYAHNWCGASEASPEMVLVVP